MVVVGLEVVDVDQHQAELALFAAPARPLRGERLVEVPAVGQAGQRVGQREAVQHPVGLAQIGQGAVELARALLDELFQAVAVGA